MDERSALRLITAELPSAGDDAAVVDGLVVTTDMLHEATDFPVGTSRYTAGWRAVGASLSDVAAMGATATATVAVYGAPRFDADELRAFVSGATAVCELVDAAYVGGDLDHHDEFTVATTAIGAVEEPVLRSGAAPGDVVAVTGTLGRTGAALRYFEAGEVEVANDLFRFEPRVHAGRAIAPTATAMMDSSDGLARSLHQLAEASDCGFAIEADALPIDPGVRAAASGPGDARELAVYTGEDFELVFTAPGDAIPSLQDACPAPFSVIGRVTEAEVTMDADALPDRGYTH